MKALIILIITMLILGLILGSLGKAVICLPKLPPALEGYYKTFLEKPYKEIEIENGEIKSFYDKLINKIFEGKEGENGD